MIQVQSKIYRDSCLPHPEFVIKRTHQHLPIIANKRNEDLLTIIKVKTLLDMGSNCLCTIVQFLVSFLDLIIDVNI